MPIRVYLREYDREQTTRGTDKLKHRLFQLYISATNLLLYEISEMHFRNYTLKVSKN